MNAIRKIVDILLTNDRHARYQRQMKAADIKRVPAPMLGTQIKNKP